MSFPNRKVNSSVFGFFSLHGDVSFNKILNRMHSLECVNVTEGA